MLLLRASPRSSYACDIYLPSSYEEQSSFLAIQSSPCTSSTHTLFLGLNVFLLLNLALSLHTSSQCLTLSFKMWLSDTRTLFILIRLRLDRLDLVSKEQLIGRQSQRLGAIRSSYNYRFWCVGRGSSNRCRWLWC